MLDVVTMGEAMALFMAEEPGPLAEVQRFRRATAGAELNVAVGLARLGLRVGYVSQIGPDHLGAQLLAFMRAEGIDVEQVSVDPGAPTGLMFKSREADGRDPRIEYFRRGSAASRMRSQPGLLAYAARARHLHLTGISPALSTTVRELVVELARQARERGCSVSFDPNLRPSLWSGTPQMIDTLEPIAALADLVMPGLAEGRLLTGRDSAPDIAAHYLARGARHVAIKLGPEGAYFADARQQGFVAGFPVATVVDTVGAGDGFAVGVISGLLDGLSLRDAVRRGNAIGARVVQFPGDCDGLPTREQLQAAMA